MTAHWNEESTIENYENKTITVGDSEYKNVDLLPVFHIIRIWRIKEKIRR